MQHNVSRRALSWLTALSLFLVAWPSLAAPSQRGFDRRNAGGNQYLVESPAIEKAAHKHKLEVLERRTTPDGDLYLVKAPRGKDLTKTQDPLLSNVEPATVASLPALDLGSVDAMEEASADLERTGTFSSPCLDAHLRDTWSGFADQRAVQMIRLTAAQGLDSNRCGAGSVVAIIDTAVDTAHPLLADALVTGFDFLSSETLTGTQADLDVRIRTIVEASVQSVLSGEASLAQVGTAGLIVGDIEEGDEAELSSLPRAYGHGTMVAGLVRLTAPAASIMPLRVFDDEGNGHVLDIIDAIYFAVANGADVINMSFSMSEASAQVEAAVEWARQNGVMTVAAAGNQSAHAAIYPAAYAATIGVASTTFDDQLSQFTNYGLVTADLTAPGNALITLFPGGGFATGWGTSFSAPLASGILALIHGYHGGSNRGAHKQVRWDLLLGTAYYNHLWDFVLSSGRLDGYGAVVEARF